MYGTVCGAWRVLVMIVGVCTDATGKVKDVHLLEPAAAPDPVGHGVEDEDLPHHGEEEGRLPLDTLSIRAVHTITE